MTIPERMDELEKKMSKLWDAMEDVKRGFREHSLSGDTTEQPESPSIFGTPQHLIPEGAVEFVSDGFRALRLRPGFEVRVVRCDGWDFCSPDVPWDDEPVPTEQIGGMVAHWTDEAAGWLRYWLSHFSEPMPGAVEETELADNQVVDGVGNVIDLGWLDGVPSYLSPDDGKWHPWEFGLGGEWCDQGDAWFEANKPDPAPEEAPSNAPLTDEGDALELFRSHRFRMLDGDGSSQGELDDIEEAIKRLASSTGSSPPLVPEETVHRVVPSGGEIGASSEDEGDALALLEGIRCFGCKDPDTTLGLVSNAAEELKAERARRDAEAERLREELEYERDRGRRQRSEKRARIADLEAQLKAKTEEAEALKEQFDVGGCGSQVEDSRRLQKLRETIDEHGIWPSEEAENEADYEACVRHMAEQLKAAKERAPDAELEQKVERLEGFRHNVAIETGIYHDEGPINVPGPDEQIIAAVKRGGQALSDDADRMFEESQMRVERDTALAQAATARERFEGLRVDLVSWAELERGPAGDAHTARIIKSKLDKFPPLPEPGEGELVVLSTEDAQALSRWANETKSPEGNSGWGPAFNAAMDVAKRVSLTIPEPVEPETTESES